MKGITTGKSSRANRRAGTDWNKLRRMSDAAIRKGVEADPDAHPTDEAFWKDAKVGLPATKQL